MPSQSRVTSATAPAAMINALQYPMPGMDVWHTSIGAPLQVSYRLARAAPADWPGHGFTGWTPFTVAQMAAVRSVFAEYSAVINVHFVETPGAADPDIELGRVNLAAAGQGGYSYGPGGLDGFAVFNKAYGLTAESQRQLLLHEIGHAMTLKHPGNYSTAGGVGPYLPAAQDNQKYTVMSYNKDSQLATTSDHLMLYDIAALQARFGANLSYHTGNDVYARPQGFIQAIWDAGGNDRIDGSHYATALKIDLRAGHFSSLGHADNFAIAYRVVIENATGGAAADMIAGNPYDNVLVGLGGADAVYGLGGNDVLSGGPGNDHLAGGAGNDILTGGPGRDHFVFDTGLSAAANVDRVPGFQPGVDSILLENAVFRALPMTGMLAAAAFHIGTAASDASDRIIYDPATGALFYDANGSAGGGSTEFAVLAPGLHLTHADFFVI